jgi:hypothetical protein
MASRRRKSPQKRRKSQLTSQYGWRYDEDWNLEEDRWYYGDGLPMEAMLKERGISS